MRFLLITLCLFSSMIAFAQAHVEVLSQDGCCVNYRLNFNDTANDWIFYPEYPNQMISYEGQGSGSYQDLEYCYTHSDTYNAWFDQTGNGNSIFVNVSGCILDPIIEIGTIEGCIGDIVSVPVTASGFPISFSGMQFEIGYSDEWGDAIIGITEADLPNLAGSSNVLENNNILAFSWWDQSQACINTLGSDFTLFYIDIEIPTNVTGCIDLFESNIQISATELYDCHPSILPLTISAGTVCIDSTCPCEATGCGSTCNRLSSTDLLALRGLSNLINTELDNNFIKGQKAFITHQKEIIDLLESDRKVNRLFKDIKSAGYELLINSLVYNKEVIVDEKYYYLINEFLSSLKNATKSNDLKKSIEQAQMYLPVIQDKEVKEAIIAFDKATITASKMGENAGIISDVKLLNNLSNNTTLLFQSEKTEGDLTIGLYDVNRRLLTQIVDCETVTKGHYQYEIDKTNLSNGVYIIKVNYATENGVYQETLKLPVSR